MTEVNFNLQMLSITKSKQLYTILRFKHPAVFKRILEFPGRRFAEQAYCYFNNIHHLPLCLQCQKKPARFISLHRGYGPYCSRGCTVNCATTLDHRKLTMMKKYGVNSPVAVRWGRKQSAISEFVKNS